MATYNLFHPGGSFAKASAGSGNQYTADTNGVIANVPLGDVPSLLLEGCLMVQYADTPELWGGKDYSGANFSTMKAEGNIYRNIGNPVAANLANTNDDILIGIALDAGAFDKLGRGLCLTAAGMFGATGNNKRIRLWINPTMVGQTVSAGGIITGGSVSGAGGGVMLFDSGTQTGNAVGWQLTNCNLFKYGIPGSNTQWFQAQSIFGSTHGGVPATILLTQNEAAIMNLVVTGASQTTGAANDVLLQFLEINAMN